MKVALTHSVSPNIVNCELSYLDRTPIDFDKAVAQHRNYCSKLEELGIRVIELSVNKDLPDSVFVEDTAVVVDEIAVMTNPGAESRRAEIPGIQKALLKYREIKVMQTPATLDGGDVLQIGREVFVGISKRTNFKGFESLKRILAPFDYRVSPIKVKGCLHLKSACTALDKETVIINSKLIETEPLRKFRLVEVDESEPEAANVLEINKTVLMDSYFPKTLNRVIQRGYQVKSIDISELRKAEAALTCSSILFDNPG